jgi:Raf kinase inhibitor-like YbhB/YbcL family protein
MSLELTSPRFNDGAEIPDEYGYTERNVNPPLSIDGVPADAVSLVLIMDDPDAIEPAGKVWDHWIVWNIDPTLSEIPEAWDANANGAVLGQTDFGERRYGGPNPPDGEHTYRFELYALDTDLDLPGSSSAEDVRDASNGSILDEAVLTGTYAP